MKEWKIDEALTPYLRWTQKDRPPGTPAISLELQGLEKLWRRTPYLFEVILRRVDNRDSSCLFDWAPHIQGFVASGFILLHHAREGLKQIELPQSTWPSLLRWVTEESCFIEHTLGRAQRWMDVLPDRFLSCLTAGERYTLFWPGERYAAWEWGVAKNHFDSYIPTQVTSLVLPGGPLLTFTVEEGEQPLHVPNTWPVEVVSRAEEAAPILIAKIACASTVPLHKWVVRVGIHITYHPGPSGETRPITFHSRLLKYPPIYQWCGRWAEYTVDGCGGGIWDDPDMEISPGDHEDFATLHPGQTLSSFVDHELPEDAQVGDSLRAQLTETKIDWWDWGTREDHLSTKVTVPCWIGPKVLHPSDNDGRAFIVVPASEPVDIQIV